MMTTLKRSTYLEIMSMKKSRKIMSPREKYGTEIIVVDNVFAYNVVLQMIQQDEDFESRYVNECRHGDDWSK